MWLLALDFIECQCAERDLGTPTNKVKGATKEKYVKSFLLAGSIGYGSLRTCIGNFRALRSDCVFRRQICVITH